jgi:cell wall-associated NlpC family hydrolase
MSFSDAIGQIDQIVQWEQQLTDPAALTQTTSTGGNSATDDTSATGGTDASTNSTFAQTLAQAQAQDATTAATTADPTDTTAASMLDPTDTTAASTLDPTATTSSDLLSGGDSQLMASLSGLSSSSTDAAAGATTSSDPTDEVSALESALGATGSTSATGATISPALVEGESGVSGGTATTPADPRIEAMTEEANALVGKPYVWGGGHDGWGPQSGYDCSGFVSAVLHAGGYLSTPQDTTTLPTSTDMESGPGQYVTVYDRDKPGQQGHVIIDIAGQFYESGGQSGSWGGGGGVEQIATPSAKYLSTFDTILHPAGL